MSSIFVSYSHEDTPWMRRVVKHLKALGQAEVKASVWDDRKIVAGQDFPDEIAGAIAEAELAILIVTVDFLNSEYITRHELPLLLERQRAGRMRVLPLLADHCAFESRDELERLQFRPRPLSPLSAQGNPNDALTRLAREVGLLLRRDRLSAATVSDAKRSSVDRTLEAIDEDLSNCWDVDAQPQRIDAALDVVRAEAMEAASHRRVRSRTRVAGTPLRTSEVTFKDRIEEQRQINALLALPDTRVVQVVGHGAMGKTALACQVLKGLEDDEWPPGCEGPSISGIIYLSTRTLGITLDRVGSELLTLLPEPARASLEQIWSLPTAKVDDKIIRLLRATRGGLYIFLLDNVEELLDAENRVTDPNLDRLLRLAIEHEHGARFVVTSRRPVDLGPPCAAVREVPLTKGLPLDDAKDLLLEMLTRDDPAGGWTGAGLEAVARRFHGVPRALELVAGALLNDPLMAADEFLTAPGHTSVKASEPIVRALAQQTYERLDQDALLVMQGLAVFGRAVKPVAVDFLLRPHFPGIDVPAVVRRLGRTHLADADRKTRSVLIHPIDRELLYDMLPASGPRSRRELHLTAAEYYVQEQVIGPLDWQDLAELDPRLHEFEHLVQAGEFDRAARRLGMIANSMTWRGLAHKVRALLAQIDGKLSEPEARLAFHLARSANATVLGPIACAVLHGRRALRLASVLGNTSEEAHAHRRIAVAYRYRLGGARKAEKHFEAAVAANDRAGTPERNLKIMCELSIGASYLREVDRALQIAREAQAILDSRAVQKLTAEQLCDVATSFWQALGYAQCLKGNHAEALEASQRAIDTWTARFAPSQVCGYALHTMALSHALHTDYEEARRAWERARKLATEQGHPRLEGICAFDLAVLAHLRGERSDAIELCHASAASLDQHQMGAPARALASWIQGSSETALEACVEAAWNCPDFYGHDLFRHWASTVRTGASG